MSDQEDPYVQVEVTVKFVYRLDNHATGRALEAIIGDTKDDQIHRAVDSFLEPGEFDYAEVDGLHAHFRDGEGRELTEAEFRDLVEP